METLLVNVNSKDEFMKVDNNIHVVPTEGKKHDESKDCWCNPELIYKDEVTDKEVWSHKGYEELNQ